MKKFLYTLLYIISLTIAGLSIHQAFAQQRAPSVEPMSEVEITAPAPTVTPDAGYNFSTAKPIAPARVPAGIRLKEKNSANSFWGPIIFFVLALPFALWVFISKKFSYLPEDKKSEYYSNTHQFKPYKTDYQKSDEKANEDDIDYPKSA